MRKCETKKKCGVSFCSGEGLGGFAFCDEHRLLWLDGPEAAHAIACEHEDNGPDILETMLADFARRVEAEKRNSQ